MTTTSDTPQPYAEPGNTVVPAERGRALASAVAVYLGGYILVQALSGQLSAALSGVQPLQGVIPLLAGQLVFALAAIVVGFFLAPTTTPRKAVASAIVVVGAILVLVVQAARIGTGFGGIAAGVTLGNSFFMVALLVGAGWLIVREARLGWLALLAAFVLIPLPYFFVMSGVSSLVSQFVLLIAFGIVGTGILIAGRPAR